MSCVYHDKKDNLPDISVPPEFSEPLVAGAALSELPFVPLPDLLPEPHALITRDSASSKESADIADLFNVPKPLSIDGPWPRSILNLYRISGIENAGSFFLLLYYDPRL